MIVTDQLVFLQLQKCASSRIAEIILEELGGRRDRQHNRVDSPRLADLPRSATAVPEGIRGKPVLGSVRDPWSWYVSLWSFGCTGQGALRYSTTAPPPRRRAAVRAMYDAARYGRSLRHSVATFRAQRNRDVAEWSRLYADPDDPALFRAWLRAVLDPASAVVIDPEYARTWLPGSSGLFTWRYIRLFWDDLPRVFQRDGDVGTRDLWALDQQHNLCTAIIRIDRLQSELISALEAAGVPIDNEGRTRLMQQCGVRRNASRHRSPTQYYDDETLDLVSAYERLIVTKHGYSRPSIA
jgi:hypothetical protein